MGVKLATSINVSEANAAGVSEIVVDDSSCKITGQGCDNIVKRRTPSGGLIAKLVSRDEMQR